MSSDKTNILIMDISKLANGLIGIDYDGPIPITNRLRVHILKSGFMEHHHFIQSSGISWYPLSYGNGTYTISLWEESVPNSNNYKKIKYENVDVNAINPMSVFLQSNINMNWSPDMECIKHAKMLASTLKTTKDKVNIVWEYIVTNYNYDYNLASSVKYNYIPDIENIFKSKKDICFGLTSLFNSMLRSINIPAKMMHGYFDNIYHAWSQVYDEKWITVDITHDIAYHQAGMKLELEKNPNEYQTKYVY